MLLVFDFFFIWEAENSVYRVIQYEWYSIYRVCTVERRRGEGRLVDGVGGAGAHALSNARAHAQALLCKGALPS